MQRFLERFYYVLDLYPNIRHLAKPSHNRLRRNHVTWFDEHSKIVKK
jgi:hypothetical protein